MKKIMMKHEHCLLVIFIGVSCIINAKAQTSSNYVKVYKAQKAIKGDLSIYKNKDSVATSIVYYDGLGRETQSIFKQQSPHGDDIVSFSRYDGYGRKTVSYLPYVSRQPAGNLIPDPLTDQRSFFTGLFGSSDGSAAFTQTSFEHSELSRIIELGAPGADWKTGAHTVRKQYLTNTLPDSVRDLRRGSFYPAHTLSCVKTIDEHGNDSYEFTDKEGRVVCKKIRAATNLYATTYYVYDDYGNLILVIPPEASAAFDF